MNLLTLKVVATTQTEQMDLFEFHGVDLDAEGSIRVGSLAPNGSVEHGRFAPSGKRRTLGFHPIKRSFARPRAQAAPTIGSKIPRANDIPRQFRTATAMRLRHLLHLVIIYATNSFTSIRRQRLARTIVPSFVRYRRRNLHLMGSSVSAFGSEGHDNIFGSGCLQARP